MRKNIFIRLFGVLLILVVAAGCRTGVVVRQPYPGTSSAKGLPPGQAKKIYGHQSAKAFAPGQQKKKAVVTESRGNSNKHKKGKKK